MINYIVLYKLTLYWKLKLNNIDIDYRATVKYGLHDGGGLSSDIVTVCRLGKGLPWQITKLYEYTYHTSYISHERQHHRDRNYTVIQYRPSSPPSSSANWGQTLNVWKHAVKQLCQCPPIKAITVDWCCQQAGQIISGWNLMFAQ